MLLPADGIPTLLCEGMNVVFFCFFFLFFPHRTQVVFLLYRLEGREFTASTVYLTLGRFAASPILLTHFLFLVALLMPIFFFARTFFLFHPKG